MAEEKVGFFKRLVNGLTKTRDSIVAGIDSIFSGYSNIDDDFYEEIEEILVMGDIGINTTTKIKRAGGRRAHYRSGRVQTASDREHQKTDGCRRYSL